jgi:tRNA(fMet)-specific endonuclease VapC
MKYLLDTNICIHYFRGKFNLDVKFDQIGIGQCAISEITLAELVYGAECSQFPQKNILLIELFSKQVAVFPIYDALWLYGKEKARLRKEGDLIGDFDLLIGCTAVANNLVMVTENEREFRRITGISIQNWIVRK